MATMGSLHALRLIETLSSTDDLRIVPVPIAEGSALSHDEMMTRKIEWATRAEFEVLSTDVPESYAPFNAVIRIKASGTEDNLRDYLAELRD